MTRCLTCFPATCAILAPTPVDPADQIRSMSGCGTNAGFGKQRTKVDLANLATGNEILGHLGHVFGCDMDNVENAFRQACVHQKRHQQRSSDMHQDKSRFLISVTDPPRRRSPQWPDGS